MTHPEIPQKAPFTTEVEAGETYWWCQCGKSANQPFCDGSHQGTDFSPVEYKAEKSETVWLCGCKKTGTPPMCDGTHNAL